MSTAQFSQLPRNVRPLKYHLTLEPDLESFVFRGEERIDIEVAETTTQIVLNAAEIVVQSARLLTADGASIEADRIDYNESSETVSFTFPSAVPTGQVQLVIEFTGVLNDRLHGFYRSTYETPDGQTHTMAATQFEPTDARRAFPCWDEPSIKATFEATLVVPSNLTVVSNTLIASQSQTGAGLNRVQFKETPPMSTYLLAFVVGELESVEGTSPDGTLARIWTTPGKSEQGRFALEVATRLLPYYNEYFGIPYPLNKLDHLAIPDFAAGAMENWGAITYREMALLFDPANSAPATRQRIAEIVAHEMAHMWFGDLVTMAWWNDLWLNESFASWMATKAVDHLFPEWNLWTQFIVMDLNSGLGLDGLENSHPIEQQVNDPSEINQLFDAISYSKGASILRMLEQFIGPETFRRGLHRYLSAHVYGNARGIDLWQAMEDESGQPVVAMMDSWIAQTGYPVVQAEIHRDQEAWHVDLTQQRFFYTGLKDDPALWQVPVVATSQDADQPAQMVMGERHGSLALGHAVPQNSDAWVKLNPAHTGFYRVSYEEREWARFIPAIESRELPPADRLGLQADAYALSRARLIPATQFLRLALAYSNEDDYSVWADLVASLRGFEHLLSREQFFSQFLTMGRDLVRPTARQLGWDARPDEGHLQNLLRSTVLGRLGAFGDAGTLEEASQRFLRCIEEPSSLAPELRSLVYGLAAQNGDATTYESLHNLAQNATLQEERIRLYMALSRFEDADLLQKTLAISMSEETRSQDTVSLLTAVSGNLNNGTALAWEFTKENWEELDRRYGAGGFAMMRLVSTTGGFTTPEARQDVEDFFQSHPVPSATRTIQQALERIDLNIRWLDHNRDGLRTWFEG